MKVYVWKDEAYPVYGIDVERKQVVIPEILYERYIAIEKEYAKVQEELKKYACE